MTHALDTTPWYRQMWPWLLMLPPVMSIAGGVAMLVLAAGSPAALVVEDYARIEALTEKRFERDRLAATLGLSAQVTLENEPQRVEVRLRSAQGVPMPDALHLQLLHATDPAADRAFELHRVAGGDVYAASAEVLAEFERPAGRYRVELLPDDAGWRLASPAGRLGGSVQLVAQAYSAESAAAGLSAIGSGRPDAR